jgi:argininosuccinate lyase
MSTDESQSERSWTHESNQLLRFGRHPELELQLAEYDLESSIAHVKMLGETKILDRETTKAMLDGLAQIKRELLEGKAYLKAEHVDIHSALEARLAELIGDLSLNLRIAKSSNDQIATDVRLWLRERVLDIFAELLELRLELTKLAERDLEIVMPGYTHMQPAMPILLSHWWLANETRFRRDFSRLTDFYRRFNVLPLGAGALAGTSQPIDRTLVAQYLNFDDVIENSLYAVSDRDFMVEFGSVASLVGLHISQIGADLLLWATQEFRFVRLRKAFVFRSQSMPQKSNPVVLEILRSRPSVIFGRLVELVAALKAVPMGYCHDLQDSLPALMDVVDTLKFSLELTRAVLQSVDVNAERMKEIAVSDLTNAAAAVDYLVNGGMPPDQASKIVEQLVNYCTQRHKSLADLELNEWQQFCPAFDTDIYQHVTMEESVGARSSFGGTSLEQVMAGIVRAKEMLELDQSNLPMLAKERIKIRQLQNI